MAAEDAGRADKPTRFPSLPALPFSVSFVNSVAKRV